MTSDRREVGGTLALAEWTLVEPSLGVLVVTNRDHHFLRRRFSTAHPPQ